MRLSDIYNEEELCIREDALSKVCISSEHFFGRKLFNKQINVVLATFLDIGEAFEYMQRHKNSFVVDYLGRVWRNRNDMEGGE